VYTRASVLMMVSTVLAGTACLSTEISDSSPPRITITSPTGTVVSGVVTIRATVLDDVGVDAVAIFIDNVKKAELRFTPYEYVWNSAGVALGPHVIRVTAKDAAGNTSTVEKVVTVEANQPD
jgi:thermitase